jgi:hypothetical protein
VAKPGAPIIGARFYCRRRPEGHDTHHAWLSAIIQRARARTPCLPVNGFQLDKTNTNLSFRFQGRRQARTVAYSETQAKLPVLLCRYIRLLRNHHCGLYLRRNNWPGPGPVPGIVWTGSVNCLVQCSCLIPRERTVDCSVRRAWSAISWREVKSTVLKFPVS